MVFRVKPHSRLGLVVRRFRGRYGIAAPRMSIRAEMPWHWRALSVVVLASCSIALAGWIYDAGRRFAGFHQEVSAQELDTLRERIVQLEAELSDTRRIANSSDSRLRIESTAQDRLAQQVKLLEEENVRLRADLSTFENLASGNGGPAGLAVSRFQLSPEGSDRYRYRLIVAQQGAGRDREFRGSLKLLVNLAKGNETVMMEFPDKGDAVSGQYSVVFKLFGRLDGVIAIPAGMRLVKAEARILEGGVVRASGSATL